MWGVGLRRFIVALLLAVMGSLAGASMAWGASPEELPSDVGYGTETVAKIRGEPQWENIIATSRSVLRAAHATFEGAVGNVFGFYPGSPYYYPEKPIPFYFYARDTATILPAARYFFDDLTLRTSIEEHLALQYGPNTVSDDGDMGTKPGPGAISATVSRGLIVNKATVVSDEETSLIHGAYVYYRTAGGARWLNRQIGDRSIIARLNMAMEWLLGYRLEPRLGVILRGTTTDWGDVKQEPGQHPTDIAPGDGWTYSIYDQSLAFSALMELSEMNSAVGQADMAERYYRQAQSLRQRTTELLWMPERGYFRIHGHLDPEFKHPFNEDEIIAIGNAAALYYGLADSAQATRIVEVLERARRESGAYKPGLTLHPPYPGGTFADPHMAWRVYQNGAVWDWWGGRQVMGEFLSGHAAQATEHLLLVANDWATHPGLVFEWESPWLNRFSHDYRYAGAAAVMAEALVEGLFGLSVDHDRVQLQPRLGTREGYVRAHVPSTDRYAAYRYGYDASARTIQLRFGTNSPSPVSIKVLLPSLGQPSGGEAGLWQAMLDDKPVAHRIERIGLDTFLATEAQAGEHLLVIRPR